MIDKGGGEVALGEGGERREGGEGGGRIDSKKHG